MMPYERFVHWYIVASCRYVQLYIRSSMQRRASHKKGRRLSAPALGDPQKRGECLGFSGYSTARYLSCLLYTSDAADDLLCVDLGGRRIIKKKKKKKN